MRSVGTERFYPLTVSAASMMQPRMLTLRQYLQIGDVIVLAVAIAMMDFFVGVQRAANVLCHNVPMLLYALVRPGVQPYIPIPAINASTAIPEPTTLAFLAAMLALYRTVAGSINLASCHAKWLVAMQAVEVRAWWDLASERTVLPATARTDARLDAKRLPACVTEMSKESRMARHGRHNLSCAAGFASSARPGFSLSRRQLYQVERPMGVLNT